MTTREGNDREFALCDITWNDDGSERRGVVFSEHSWEDAPEIDERVFFSGYTAEEYILSSAEAESRAWAADVLAVREGGAA